MARGPRFLASGVRLCSMSSTDPRARKGYLRLGYGPPSAERLEALPALGVVDHFDRFSGAANTALRLASEPREAPTNKRRCQTGAGEGNAAAQIRVKT